MSEIHIATFADFRMLYIETEGGRAIGVAEVSWNASFAGGKERINHYSIPVWRERLKILYLRGIMVTFFFCNFFPTKIVESVCFSLCVVTKQPPLSPDPSRSPCCTDMMFVRTKSKVSLNSSIGL